MKHNYPDTIEMLAWVLLGAVIGLAMIPAAKVAKEYQTMTMSPTMFALFLIGLFIFYAVLFWVMMKFWEELPLWLRAGLVIIGMIGMLYGWSKLAVLGVLWMAGKSNVSPPILSVLFVAMGTLLLWYLNIKKLARPIAVRATNVLMLCTIATVSALIASKLSVFAALIFLFALAVYDAIAVWKIKNMQKMALGLLDAGIPAGIMIPKKKPIVVEGRKIDVALLGYGDVMVIIAVGGVLMPEFGIWPIVGMYAAIIYLFFASSKKKFYPAVPYLLAGCLLGMIPAVML